MNPYLVLYFYILISMGIRDKFRVKNIRFLNVISNPTIAFFILFLFAAFRGNGDGDYFNYINSVKLVNSLEFLFNPISYPFEFGLRFLSYISNLLGTSPQFVIISMNAISFGSIYYVLKKTNTDILMGAFYFFSYHVAIRHASFQTRSSNEFRVGFLCEAFRVQSYCVV